jgi:hypothetical protein
MSGWLVALTAATGKDRLGVSKHYIFFPLG